MVCGHTALLCLVAELLEAQRKRTMDQSLMRTEEAADVPVSPALCLHCLVSGLLASSGMLAKSRKPVRCTPVVLLRLLAGLLLQSQRKTQVEIQKNSVSGRRKKSLMRMGEAVDIPGFPRLLRLVAGMLLQSQRKTQVDTGELLGFGCAA